MKPFQTSTVLNKKWKKAESCSQVLSHSMHPCIFMGIIIVQTLNTYHKICQDLHVSHDIMSNNMHEFECVNQLFNTLFGEYK